MLSVAYRLQILSHSHDTRSNRKTHWQGLHILQISAQLMFSRQSDSLLYKKFNYRKTTEPFSTIFGSRSERASGHILLENGGGVNKNCGYQKQDKIKILIVCNSKSTELIFLQFTA